MVHKYLPEDEETSTTDPQKKREPNSLRLGTDA